MYVIYLTLNVLLFVLVLVCYRRHRAASWYHPLTIYLAFHGFVFVIRPILSWFYDYRFVYSLYLFEPSENVKAMALIVANLGLISFAWTSLHFGDVSLRLRRDRAAELEREALAGPLWCVTLLLLPLIAYSLQQAWLLRTTNADAIFIDRLSGNTIVESGNGYLQAAHLFIVVLVPLIAWTQNFRPAALGMIAATALVLAGSGVRGPIASLAVLSITLYLHSRGKARPGWVIVGSALLALSAFNAIGSDRGQAVRAILTGEQDTTQFIDETQAPLEGMDFASLEYVEYLVDKVPDQTGTYEYFVDLLQLITEPIPRALWKEKPVGQPIRFFSLFRYGNPIGMTRSLPGEGWTELGLVGVVLWCGLWGGILGRVYSKYVRGPQTFFQTAVYAALLGVLIIFYRDGSILTLVRQMGVFVTPLVMLAILKRLLGIPSLAHLARQSVSSDKRRQRFASKAEVAIPPEFSEVDRKALPRSQRRRSVALNSSPVLPRSLRHRQ